MRYEERKVTDEEIALFKALKLGVMHSCRICCFADDSECYDRRVAIGLDIECKARVYVVEIPDEPTI